MLAGAALGRSLGRYVATFTGEGYVVGTVAFEELVSEGYAVTVDLQVSHRGTDRYAQQIDWGQCVERRRRNDEWRTERINPPVRQQTGSALQCSTHDSSSHLELSRGWLWCGGRPAAPKLDPGDEWPQVAHPRDQPGRHGGLRLRRGALGSSGCGAPRGWHGVPLQPERAKWVLPRRSICEARSG